MGVAPSHDHESRPRNSLPPPQPMLGPRPQNPQGNSFSSFRENPRFMRSVEYLQPVQMTGKVESVIVVNKDKLRLIPTNANPPSYIIDFEFSAKVEGTLTISYIAKEHIELTKLNGANTVSNLSYIPHFSQELNSTTFQKGNNQIYHQPEQQAIEKHNFTSAQLKYSQNGLYPLVIKLDPSYNSANPTEYQSTVRSHITLAEILTTEPDWTIRVIEQKVLIGGTIHSMQAIYGIKASFSAHQAGTINTADGSSAECVVCLTEPSTTALQPCHHLCLCDECARVLTREVDAQQQKCPVCRTNIGKLLRIIDTTRRKQEPEPGNTISQNVAEGNQSASSLSPILPYTRPPQQLPNNTSQASNFQASDTGQTFVSEGSTWNFPASQPTVSGRNQGQTSQSRRFQSS